MKAFVGWVLTVSVSVMLGLLLYSTSLSGSPTEYQEAVISPQPTQTIVKTKIVRRQSAPGGTGQPAPVANSNQGSETGESGYSGYSTRTQSSNGSGSDDSARRQQAPSSSQRDDSYESRPSNNVSRPTVPQESEDRSSQQSSDDQSSDAEKQDSAQYDD